MKINSLSFTFGYSGKMNVEIWATLYTPGDIDEMIEWLKLAKDNALRWEKINALASQAAEAAPAKHEVAKPGKVQGKP